MNTDDLLKKQIALTQKIIERMDYIIDGIKMELNITKDTDPKVTFYTPSGKKEWFGIPDSIVNDDDDLDQMDACLVRNVAKSQRKTILKMEIEMEALRAIIDDMRGQINRQAIRELEVDPKHEEQLKEWEKYYKKLKNEKQKMLTQKTKVIKDMEIKIENLENELKVSKENYTNLWHSMEWRDVKVLPAVSGMYFTIDHNGKVGVSKMIIGHGWQDGADVAKWISNPIPGDE